MNIEQIKRHIDGIFHDYAMHFLAYEGGSGGEFLISKLRQYSPTYSINNTLSNYYSNNNRTILEMNSFLSAIYFSRLNEGGLVDLKDLILKEILRIADNDQDRAVGLIEDTRNILHKPGVNLCKLHLTSNSYFDKSNTWTLYIDSQESFNYIKRLRFIKVFKNKWSIEQIVDNYSMNYRTQGKLHLLEDLAAWAGKNNITELEEIYLPCIFTESIYKNFRDYDELMSHSPIELYKQYTAELDLTFTAKSKFYQMTSANTNRIHFSKLFETGYLEDAFMITDPDFRKDLLSWHENNLKLLAADGLDHQVI